MSDTGIKFFKRAKPANIKEIAAYLPKNLLASELQTIKNRKIFKVCKIVKTNDNIPDTQFENFNSSDDPNWTSQVVFHPTLPLLAESNYNTRATIYHIDPVDQTNYKKPLIIFRDHELAVHNIAFSDSGKLFASCGCDGKVFIYDFDFDNKETFGKKIREISLEGTIYHVKFSPDEKTVAFGNYEGHVYIFSVEPPIKELVEEKKITPKIKKEKKEKKEGELEDADEEEDEEEEEEGEEEEETQFDEKDALHKFKFHSKLITGIEFSKNGRFLISSSEDKKVIIYDLNSSYDKDENIVNQALTDEDEIHCLTLNPTDEYFVTGNATGKLNLYKFYPTATDLIFGEFFMALDSHKVNVNDVKFGPSGRFLASVSNDRYLFLFDVDHKNIGDTFGKKIREIPLQFSVIVSLSIDHTDEYLSLGSWDEKIKLYC